MPLGLVAILYFAYNVFAVYSGSQGNVAYLGHVIGFLTGVPFGIGSSQEWGKNVLITMGLFVLYFLIVRILLPLI
jgi:membrane associated rhomboid family serine protease